MVDSDVILHTPPRWRYTIVASVLRHKRTYARELPRELYTVRNACSANNFGIRNVDFRIFTQFFIRIIYTSNMTPLHIMYFVSEVYSMGQNVTREGVIFTGVLYTDLSLLIM